MVRSGARFGTLAFTLGVVVALLPVSAASAAHVARLDATPAQVASGGEVTVVPSNGWAPVPVVIHWNAVDGEVLATLPTTAAGSTSFAPGTVRIPNVPPGMYELVGTQQAPATQTALRGVPARARIQVTGGGTAPTGEQRLGDAPLRRLGTLEKKGGAQASTALLIAVGVFVVTLAAGLLVGSAMRRKAGVSA